jgi:WD40 repeat protein
MTWDVFHALGGVEGAQALFQVVAIGLTAFAYNRQAAAVANLTNSERLRLAAEANIALERGESGNVPALLAIRSLQSGYTPQADAALARALERGFIRQTFKGNVGGVAFSPDGKQVLTGNGNVASLWDAQTGRGLRQFSEHTDSVNSARFSLDGTTILTASSDKTVRLWDARMGAQQRALTGHTDAILSAIFSPDGRYVLTGSVDDTARLWDAQTGEQIRVFSAHTNAVTSVAFSLDGQSIFTGSWDGTVRRWRIDYHDAIRLACAQLPRDLTDQERRVFAISDDKPTCTKE